MSELERLENIENKLSRLVTILEDICDDKGILYHDKDGIKWCGPRLIPSESLD